MPQVSIARQIFYPRFFRHNIGDRLADAGFRCPDGFHVRLTPGVRNVVIQELGAGDMFSHPYIGFAADEDIEETQAFRQFIKRLLVLKQKASPELRWYVLQLIYDDEFRQRFLAHPDEALAVASMSAEEKQALRQAVNELEAKVEDFKPTRVVDDGDHFLLFPQTVEKVAPRAWLEAAWSYIAHFRSNFGLYLGEALLYSRVTILGQTTANPAVTEQQEAFLKTEGGRGVERIAIRNAADLGRVLNWGMTHEVRFGLGDAVTQMILDTGPENEIMAAIQQKFEPDRLQAMTR